MKNALSAIIITSVALSACAGSSDSPNPASAAVENIARAALPDNSAKVEAVQGENPVRYFIANQRALNAVDKDGNGIWDDIEAGLERRLAAEPDAVKTMDRRPLLQIIRGQQAKMLFTSVAEATADKVSLYSFAGECMRSMVKAGLLPDSVLVSGRNRPTVEYLRDMAVELVMTSKERVLASRYADGLKSGSSLSGPGPADRGLIACSK